MPFVNKIPYLHKNLVTLVHHWIRDNQLEGKNKQVKDLCIVILHTYLSMYALHKVYNTYCMYAYVFLLMQSSTTTTITLSKVRFLLQVRSAATSV